MKKDPAVLWYTNDFLEGTADLSPEEIGVYTILLCYQHRRGFLPDNLKKLSRLVRLQQSEFEPIWKEVSEKFVSYASVFNQSSDPTCELFSDDLKGKIVNRRMFIEAKKRTNYLGKKAVFAVVGNWFRHHSTAKKLRKSQKEKIKKQIDYPFIFESLLNKEEIEDYINKIADRFLKGSDQGTLFLENEDVNENVNVNEIEDENENENEDVNNIIEGVEIPKFEKLANDNFKERLGVFFSQNGMVRFRKVEAFLQKLGSSGELEEFVLQSEAYMAYKRASQERIHGWRGYTSSWRQTDWVGKLRQLRFTEMDQKKKFSINR
ncbi:DUF1376 domain-containing protein [Aquimarina sp. SS2-1]|uniref:DUF1376 domain-containing protein n=1 Tax=Aquimarina besae TaxID=3342247 RepID=UPI00366B0EB4